MPIDRSTLRAKLEALKAELEAAPDAVGAADRAPVELDQTSVGRLSRIDAMQVQAMALATEQRRKSELARVNAALERIDSEEFGHCEICGEQIAPARLAHSPAVTRCIGCAK
jgi:DnaK suppressor protein